MSRRRPALDRFLEKVDKSGDCWLWTASLMPSGYGKFWDGDRLATAHRWSYEHFIGPIPDGLDLDHLCRVRSCCNPAHLEAVDRRENLLRGETIPAAEAAKTHCPSGHPYSERNTMVDKKGRRSCRTCHREWQLEYNRRTRGVKGRSTRRWGESLI